MDPEVYQEVLPKLARLYQMRGDDDKVAEVYAEVVRRRRLLLLLVLLSMSQLLRRFVQDETRTEDLGKATSFLVQYYSARVGYNVDLISSCWVFRSAQ